MNLALATGPLAQAIGWALLHLVWQGALVAALLALVLVLLSGRAASLRYAVSCGALALVVMMGVVTGVRSYPGRVAAQPKLDPSPSRTFLVLPSAVSPITVATFTPARVDRLRDLARTADRALPAIVTFWLLGVALLTARLVIQWLQARRLVTGSASPAREPWPSLARRLALALGVRHAVRLLESTAIEVPAVLGVLRPVILLPASAVTGLTTAQLEMILAHELAHIRRHDFLVNLFQSAVETLLFYHPAVWWISRQMRIERENCCDDLAVAVCGTPLQYARALARLEELRADALPLAVSAKGGSLMERIRRIVRGSRVKANPVRGAAALAVLVFGLLAIAGPSLSAMSRRQTDVKWSRRHRSASFTRFESRAAEARDAESRHAEARDADCPDKVEVKEEAQGDEAADAALAGEESQQATAAVAEGDEETNADARFMAQIAGMHGHQRLSLDELIQLRQQDVTPSEVLEMRFLFPGMDIREIAGMNAVGATPEFVRKLRAAGLDVKTPSEAQGLAAVGVTPEFIHDMSAAGLDIESANEAQGLAAVGVTSEFIRAMREAGLRVESAQEAQGLAAVGVTGDFISGMREAGLEVRSASEAQGLAAVGVTPEFIAEMREAGLSVESAQEAQGLAAVGVTAEFISGMREAGLPVESAQEAQSLMAVGVTPEYVDGLRRAGVEFESGKDVQSLRALNISPEFVRRLAKAGYRHLTVSELCRLGAAGVSDDFVREMARYRTK